MISVAVVGATGYAGVELLRLLASHPKVEVTQVTSRGEAGKSVADLFPNLRGHYSHLIFEEPSAERLAQADVVFFATPHATAMYLVPALRQRGVKVVDISADFRIEDVPLWEQWYGVEHSCPSYISEAVYGLPEANREHIKSAELVAVPGCYPTAVQLGFKPLLDAGLVDSQRLIADCKSGVSGAGRGAKVGSLFCEAGDNMMAYASSGHRHLPEISQGLARFSGASVGLTFMPHLTPMIRGIHATLYATVTTECDVQALFESTYVDEPFVDVLPADQHPQTRSVRGVNVCRIAVARPAGSDQVVVMSVIDNLVKGASGQAIQNFNLMFGLPETMGLDLPALLP